MFDRGTSNPKNKKNKAANTSNNTSKKLSLKDFLTSPVTSGPTSPR